MNRLLHQTHGLETRVTNESFLLSIGSKPPSVSAPLVCTSSHSRLGSAHMNVIIPRWRPACGCSKEEDRTVPRLETLAPRSKKVDVSSVIYHCCHYPACPHVRSSFGSVIFLNDEILPISMLDFKKLCFLRRKANATHIVLFICACVRVLFRSFLTQIFRKNFWGGFIQNFSH